MNRGYDRNDIPDAVELRERKRITFFCAAVFVYNVYAERRKACD